jgi:hypothetical protein
LAEPIKTELGVANLKGPNMEEILVCLAMTVIIHAFMIVAYKKGW